MGISSRWLAGALLVPFLVVTIGIAALAVAERRGFTPLSDGPPRNGAEAAAMGSGSDLLRFLRLGEDPYAVHAIRPSAGSSGVRRATTLEAAVASGSVAMVRLLDREGFLVGHEIRHELACLASDLNAVEIVAYFAPDGRLPACTPGAAAARVRARFAPEVQR